MQIDEFQTIVASQDFLDTEEITEAMDYPQYLVMGLLGESAELAAESQPMIRLWELSEAVEEAIVLELGDILWYSTRLVAYYGFQMTDILKTSEQPLYASEEIADPIRNIQHMLLEVLAHTATLGAISKRITNQGFTGNDDINDLIAKLGDISMSCGHLAYVLGYELEEVLHMNNSKIQGRLAKMTADSNSDQNWDKQLSADGAKFPAYKQTGNFATFVNR